MTRPAGRGALSLTVAAMLLLAGCAPVGDPRWTPPDWSAATVRVVAEPDVVDVDTTAVAASLTAQRIRNDAVGVQARWSQLPGRGAVVDRFNDAVEAIVRDAVAAQSATAGVAYRPAAHPEGAGLEDRTCVAGSTTRTAAEILADPALGPDGGSGTAVVCDVVVAAGSIFAQRMRVVSGTADAVAADRIDLLYVDTATGEVSPASGLWQDDALDALGADIVDALRRDAGALSLATATFEGDEQREVLRTALATTVPGPDGGLAFTIPAGFRAPELASLGAAETSEPLTVAVPADRAAALVTPLGSAVLAAVGQPYAGPPAVPAGFDRLDCALVPCVALTYDDGPTVHTPRLLDELAELRASATLYVLGQYAAGAPDTVRRAAAEGHEIGNHTWNHPSLPSLTAEQVRDQLGRTTTLLRSLSGQPVATFRPPYGEFTAEVLTAAGEPAMIWTVDTRDWAGPAESEIIARSVEGATVGGIILLHDTQERSVSATPAIVSGLRDRGFSTATITQLFDGDLPASGAWRAAP